MRSLLNLLKSPRQPIFFHEYQSHRIKRPGYYFSAIDHRTSFFVVFDGETQRRFSSVRIVLYCNTTFTDSRQTWAIKQLESVTHSSKDHHALQNIPTLPQLTVAFEVFPRAGAKDMFDLIPPSSDDDLRRRDSKSVCILLESNHSVTPDTQFVSVTFDHSRLLCTPSSQLDPCTSCDHNLSDTAYVTTRTVRVVPTCGARPRTTIWCLPTELLMKIFEISDFCAWQQDLLSFAQVCHQWSQGSMKLLFSRLESSDWKNHCLSFPSQSLDVCAFGKALRKTPVLGLGMKHLDLDQHNGSQACWNHFRQKAAPGSSQALVTILRATKDLHSLHLSLGYSNQSNAFFSSLPKLHHLHTLSITRTTCQFSSTPGTKYWVFSIETIQLARCMARWPSLTSLTVEYLMSGYPRMGWLFLRPPACALTQLCLRGAHILGEDLLHLAASSAKTLSQVTLDSVSLISDDALGAFLDAISGNVTSLTLWNVWYPDDPYVRRRKKVYVLDGVVDKMFCLRALDIRGNGATACMLRRRSEMFVRCRESGVPVPVVRLTFQGVRGFAECDVRSDEWVGWEIVAEDDTEADVE